MARIKGFLKKALYFIANPRLLLCLGIAWIITNGWSYICLGIGIALDIPWLSAVAGAYLGFLWFPFTPEKILTVLIAIFLLRLFFPRDEHTLGILRRLFRREREGGKKKRDEGSE
ncbi:MAG: hypothetical protein IKA64_00950 [Clostridia bacterium]|nr:hypothetical protein [Clostridia bacterium]